MAAVVLTLLTNTFVAYAVARNMDKRFFRFLYYFFIAAMFVPFPVVMRRLRSRWAPCTWTTRSA